MISHIWDFGMEDCQPLANSVDVIKGLMGSAGPIDFARGNEWAARRFFCVVGQINIK